MPLYRAAISVVTTTTHHVYVEADGDLAADEWARNHTLSAESIISTNESRVVTDVESVKKAPKDARVWVANKDDAE